MTDYATLARIEDHLRRIADALERAHPKFHPGGYVGGDYTLPEMPLRGYGRLATRDEIRAFWESCDDRTCTDREHWAPSISRWDDCETRDPNQCEPGCARPSLHDGDCVITWPGTATIESDDRHRRAMSDGEAQRILRAGQELGFVAEADPLDESDHRPRHDKDGRCWRKDGRWWRTDDPRNGKWVRAETLAVLGPLTFCDCDAATIEVENGATD